MPVARSKLIAPPLQPEAAWADGLVAGLAARAATSRVTLLQAPGGTGKTTLTRALVEEVDAPWGWCRLDRHDDLVTTSELLVAALSAADPAIGDELDDVAVPSGPDAARALGVALTNAVTTAGALPVVLAVDDAHEISDPAIHELLQTIVATAPPGLHLVIASRTALPGLGGARELALGTAVAVDTEVLRIDEEVGRRILTELGWEGTEDDLTQLVERSGGWVLGLRLLADLHGEAEVGEDLVRRYLEEEILAARERSEVQVLEALAVLDEVTVDAVRRFRPGPGARRWLDDLVRTVGLLVIRVDAHTVRLHDLLREALLDRLCEDAERLAAAHRAAAMVASTWQARVDHLLAAGDEGEAAHLLDITARDAFPQPVPLAQVADRVARLPSAIRDANPWLRVVHGSVLAQRSLSTEALEVLDRAWQELEPDELLGRWSTARHALQLDTDMELWSERLAGLEREPTFSHLPPAVRTDHHIALAHACYFAGAPEAAAMHRDEALSVARISRDPGAVEVLAQHYSTFMAELPGGVAALRGWARWCERELLEPTPLAQLGMSLHRAGVAFYTGDHPQALAEVVRASPLAERHHLAWMRLMLDWVLVSIRFARGDLAPAAALLSDRHAAPGPLATAWAGLLARVRSAQGDAAAVAAVPVPSLDGAPASLRGVLAAAAAVVRAEQARAGGDPDHAVAILEGHLAGAQSPIVVPNLGRLELDLVVALHAAERPDDALHLLLDQLALLDHLEMLGIVASHGRALRPLLERAVAAGLQAGTARRALSLTDRTDQPASVAVAQGIQLSPREVEVLRLLAAGHSNRRIADELTISLNTVKTHVRRVLAKLEVDSRTAAAVRANRLGIGAG